MARIIHTKGGVVADQYILKNSSVTIGRAPDNHIHLQDQIVSSQHAEIFVETNEKGKEIYFLQDLKSKNGSFINKKKIVCKQLRNKDRIKIGCDVLMFIDEEDSVTN